MKHESPVLFRVRAALAKGATEEASSVIREAVAADRMSGNLMIARYFRAKRLFPRAIDYYRAAQLEAPEVHVPALYAETARVFLGLKCHADARLFARDGLALFPDDVELMLLDALSLAHLGEGEAAAQVVADVLEREVDPALSELFGDVLRKLVGVSTADKPAAMGVEDLVKVYRALPDLPDVGRVTGEWAMRVNDTDLAIEAFGQAVARYPDGGRKVAVQKSLAKLCDRPEIEAASGEAPQLAAPAIHEPFTVAAITNVYNEKHNMPVWLRHYGRQVGAKHCVVLDHGSNDGSTDDLGGAGVVRLARGKVYDERARMKLVTDLANSLLGYYNAVIYSDCDEMFVADPDKYADITDYARQMKKPVAFAVGLNVRHNPEAEADLTDDAPVLSQRSLVQFVSPMCKPLLITQPVSWGGGFHCCEREPTFDDAYMFHLRHADMRRALDRLKTTRVIQFAREGAGKHHRRDEGELIEKAFKSVAKWKVKDDFDFSDEIKAHKAGIGLSFSGRYAVQKSVNVKHLNRIPERFATVF